jgi:hypothetical protein
MEVDDLIRLRKLVTPAIIEVVFWVTGGFSFVGGLVQVVSGLSASFGGGRDVLVGLLIMLLGPLVARVCCEVVVVLFRIHSALDSIEAALIGDAVRVSDQRGGPEPGR